MSKKIEKVSAARAKLLAKLEGRKVNEARAKRADWKRKRAS